MLRATLLYSASVAIALAVLFVTLFVVTYKPVSAKTTRLTAPTSSASPSATVQPSPTPINYPLPYPGILPDSPLWILKAARDRILLWVTFDSKAKVDRLLLYADKRLGAGQALIDGGKIDLGVSTTVKGENYLQQSVSLYNEKSDIQNSSETAHLKLAIAKHLEIIKSLQTHSPDLNAVLGAAVQANQSASDSLKSL